MYAQTEQPKENKNQTKAVTKSQNRGSVNAAAQLVDNRPQTVAQRKRQTEIHSESVQSHGTSTSIIQRVAIPATVTGLTHLVEARNGSIFEGREVREVSHGMTIEIENSDKIRSRRGPNQESNRASDLGNTPAYRWVRVIRVNNEPIGNNIYIRDDTFVTQHPQPLGPRPSVISDDHRERSSDTPGQNVYLLGTTHIDEPQYDESNKVSDGEMAGSDLIVEHPTPLGRRATKLDPTIRDPTQRELLKRANENGAHIIGGDGRKLANANGSIHALSTRSQAQELDLAPNINSTHISALAEQFVDACLGIGSGNIRTIIQNIHLLGNYRRTGQGQLPDVVAILNNGYRRVHTITEYFKPQVKMALKNKVMAVFRRDVAKASEDTQEELNGLHGFYGNKVLSSEDQQIYDNGVRDYEKQLAAAAISPFHDAISNMTLFAEALASNKQNLVVAFGAEHVAPLHELLTEVNGVHKHYNIEDKTSNNDN